MQRSDGKVRSLARDEEYLQGWNGNLCPISRGGGSAKGENSSIDRAIEKGIGIKGKIITKGQRKQIL